MPVYGSDIGVEINDSSGNTLLSSLDALVGDSVPWDIALGWFNDAINELTNDLNIEAKAQIATVSGILNYPIPDNCLSIVSFGLPFTTWAGEIILDSDPLDAGIVDLYYYRKPFYLSDSYDIPVDVPTSAHYALVLYAAMRYKQSDDEFVEADRFEKDFEKKKDLMIDEIFGKTEPSTVKVVW